jgi:hypothetical protein
LVRLQPCPQEKPFPPEEGGGPVGFGKEEKKGKGKKEKGWAKINKLKTRVFFRRKMITLLLAFRDSGFGRAFPSPSCVLQCFYFGPAFFFSFADSQRGSGSGKSRSAK